MALHVPIPPHLHLCSSLCHFLHALAFVLPAFRLQSMSLSQYPSISLAHLFGPTVPPFWCLRFCHLDFSFCHLRISFHYLLQFCLSVITHFTPRVTPPLCRLRHSLSIVLFALRTVLRYSRLNFGKGGGNFLSFSDFL